MSDRFKFKFYHPDHGMSKEMTIREVMRYGGPGMWYYYEDTVSIQSTGLRDKNGVLIFEGDIVKCIDGACSPMERHDEIHSVEWSDGSFGINGEYLDFYNRSYIEVIGNIHQDSHLLDNPEPDAQAERNDDKIQDRTTQDGGES